MRLDMVLLRHKTVSAAQIRYHKVNNVAYRAHRISNVISTLFSMSSHCQDYIRLPILRWLAMSRSQVLVRSRISWLNSMSIRDCLIWQQRMVYVGDFFLDCYRG